MVYLAVWVKCPRPPVVLSCVTYSATPAFRTLIVKELTLISNLPINHFNFPNRISGYAVKFVSPARVTSNSFFEFFEFHIM